MLSTKSRNALVKRPSLGNATSIQSSELLNAQTQSDHVFGRNQKVRSMVFQLGNSNQILNDGKYKRHSEGMIFKPPGIEVIPDWMLGWQSQTRIRSVPDFLSGKQYGYMSKVYLAAAQIFERLANKKEENKSLIQYGLPGKEQDQSSFNFDSPRIKRQAYELAYEALKYQELLEEILIDSGFLFAQAISDELMPLVIVLLFDFQNRKFDPWCRVIGDDTDSDVISVQESLIAHKTRIAAALARCRVKNQSLTIDYVLPANVREQEKCASKLPQTTWVNTIKMSVPEVIENLTKEGYTEINDEKKLLMLRGKYFSKDLHCDDVLLFSSDQKEHLKSLHVVVEGNLVLQDKTSSLAAHAIGALLTEDDEYDILHTDVASGLTTAHLAILLHNKTKKKVETRTKMFSNPMSSNLFFTPSLEGIEQSEKELKMQHIPTVFACGVRNESHRTNLQKLMDNLGITNVKLLSERFENINPGDDDRFKKVKLILSSPQCSRTAVANPIDFMLNEGDKENYNVLRDLSLGQQYDSRGESGRALLENVKIALKFPTAQACVYVTRSVLESENENVVKNAVKWQRQSCSGTQPFRVCPPTLPLTSENITSMTSSLKDNYLKLRQTPLMNGCFIAVLSRELDNDEMTVKDILRRAALKGLVKPISITGDVTLKNTEEEPPKKTPSPTEDEKKVKPKLKKKPSYVKPSPVTVQKKTKSTAALSERQKTPSTDHKPDASDIHKLLGIYQHKNDNEMSPKSRRSEGYFRATDEVNQVNLNLEFKTTTSMKFTRNQESQDSRKIEKRHKGKKKNDSNVKVETLLEELSGKESRT